MGKVKEILKPVVNKLSSYVNGLEVPDPNPLEAPIGFKKPMSMNDRIRQMIRSEQLRMAADQSGMETFEEADDFDIGDDYDPHSPFEEVFDPEDKISYSQWVKERSEKSMKEEALKDKPPAELKARGEPTSSGS